MSKNDKTTYSIKKATALFLIGFSLITSGCDRLFENNGDGYGSQESGDSEIQYLKNNHNSYSSDTYSTPSPTKNESQKSIKWTISGQTIENATKLAKHISFMTTKLKEGKTPRKWDKLFIMEAYMKVNKKYTTSVKKIDKKVLIEKVATTMCAYKVISAHSDAVSGDFFGQGVISNDYSSTADNILASSFCEKERNSIKSYIANNLQTRGNRTNQNRR